MHLSRGPISAKDCVRALVRAGFVVTGARGATILLERRGRVVLVPGARVLQPEVITVIARAAGLSQAELDASVGAVRRDTLPDEDREIESRP
jgi:predicted RNA binding protein YcfA (HicA-like mRNA interferase family)